MFRNTNFIVYSLLCFIFVYCEKEYIPNTNSSFYRCKESNRTPRAIKPENIVPGNNQRHKERSLSFDRFKDFNIHLDLYNFDDEIIKYKLQSRREMYVKALQKAIQTIQSLLKIKELEYNYMVDDFILESISIFNWDKTKIGTELYKEGIGMKDLDIDLYIFVRFGDNDEMGNLIFANARCAYLELDTGRPLIGLININKDYDYHQKDSFDFLKSLLLHELTHTLGFDRYFFENIFHIYFTKVDEYGITRHFINSTKVLKVAKRYFNCDLIEGVELENDRGQLTAGSHWEGRILLGEYMNGILYPTEQVISEFTLALLEDTGNYKANYYTGGLMQFGKNKGCEFLNSKCIVNRKINQRFSNEFFDRISNTNSEFDASCSSGRQSRAYHTYYYYLDKIPKEYQYFNSDKKGGWDGADYCPVSLPSTEENKNNYYVGHCSEKGSGIYGKEIFFRSEKLTYVTGEYLSNNSFCALSSLVSKNINDYWYYSRTLRAVCYKMHCSDKSLTVEVKNNFIVCPRSGGKVSALNFYGYLLCPDYNLICSGTVLCNDMFDCVDKKSLLKNNIIYDYETKTTQDYRQIDRGQVIKDVYELSSNGKCPINCAQCDEKGYCVKCRKNYSPLESIKNGRNLTECVLTSELSVGYFLKNNVYRKCIDNCNTCQNNITCQICVDGFIFNKTKCITCPAGKYAKKGLTYCSTCSAGTYSKENSTSCTKCPAGTFSKAGSSECIKCPSGTYSKQGSYACSICLAGTFSSEGAAECIKCNKGYISTKGASRCTVCPEGK